jgi:type IV secretory pathway VirJ component
VSAHFSAAAVAIFAVLASTSARGETLDGASFGEVRVVAPASAPLRYVTLFSGAAGWSADDDRTLDALGREGALAVGVDAKVYLENIAVHRNAVRPAECVDVFQDVEDLSRRLQGRHPSAFYNLPIVAGHGEGGALAFVALAQAPVATVSAAISFDPTATIGTTRALCRLDGYALADGGRRLGPVSTLQGEWRAVFDAYADRQGRERVEALSRAGTPVKALSSPDSGERHGLASLVEAYIADVIGPGVRSLPLIELPVAKHPKAMAVLLSGDGGWRDLDKAIGEKLQERGVPVVGWDSLRYFWRRKSADQTAADLKSVLDYYRVKWGVEKVALIGYSFGADVMPVVYNKLPQNDRDRIALLSLMGLEPKAEWEIRVVGWFGARPSDEATLLAPEFARIPGSLVQCFYGAEEQEPGCLTLTDPRTEIIQTPGAHHFGHAYDEIATAIVEGLRRRRAL